MTETTKLKELTNFGNWLTHTEDDNMLFMGGIDVKAAAAELSALEADNAKLREDLHASTEQLELDNLECVKLRADLDEWKELARVKTIRVNELVSQRDEAIRVIEWAEKVNDVAKLNGAGAWSNGCNLDDAITAFIERVKKGA
jgi:hypothetical protein